MASGKLTFTGPYGPGLSLTSKVFSNLSRIEWDFVNGTIRVVSLDPNNPGSTLALESDGLSSLTGTISGGVTSITLS